MKRGVLVLRDGTVVWGDGFGAAGEVEGEVVFNTSMAGYPEYLTDPSYRYQILMPTYPLIGNYGVAEAEFESDRIQVEGFVVGEWCRAPSHEACAKTVNDFLKEHGVPGLAGVDTRFLTRKIRVHGVIEGILKSPAKKADVPKLKKKAAELDSISDKDLIDLVSTKKTVIHKPEKKAKETVVLIDCGVKLSIIRELVAEGFKVAQVPAKSSIKDVLKHEPDAVMVSNGPGDPERAGYAIKTIRKVVDEQIPVWGICMGNQLTALALGAKTFKLKFGHRGGNQPVKEHSTGRVYVTSQNHGFAVDPDSLDGTGLKVTHTNLNDGTVEGLVHESLPVKTVQYHPEAMPGPWDSRYLFKQFRKLMKK